MPPCVHPWVWPACLPVYTRGYGRHCSAQSGPGCARHEGPLRRVVLAVHGREQLCAEWCRLCSRESTSAQSGASYAARWYIPSLLCCMPASMPPCHRPWATPHAQHSAWQCVYIPVPGPAARVQPWGSSTSETVGGETALRRVVPWCPGERSRCAERSMLSEENFKMIG